MKKYCISIFARFETDGDFFIESFDDLFGMVCRAENTDGTTIRFRENHCDFEEYVYDLIVSGDSDACKSLTIAFLKILSTRFRVGYAHNHLLEDLYELCKSAGSFVIKNDGDDGYCSYTIGGNYYGTEIRVSIFKDESNETI